VPDFLWGEKSAYSILNPPNAKFAQKLTMIKYLMFPNKAPSNGINPTVLKFFNNHLLTNQNIENSKFLYQQINSFPKENDRMARIENSDTGQLISFIQNNLSKKWGVNGQNITVFALFGELDIVSNDRFINKWKKNLPQLRGNVKIIGNSGHQIQEEQPTIISSYILKANEIVNQPLGMTEPKIEG